MRYLLYHPLSGKGNQAREEAEGYSVVAKMPTELVNLAELENEGAFLESLSSDDDVVIFGGDGSLNQFVNQLSDSMRFHTYYYPCGTGNDFARDVGITVGQEPILIDSYIQNLPTVTVNGKKSRFINGVGFGIDGYCCEVGDLIKSRHKSPNYTAIAIKGLLFYFKPVNASVTVDGKTTEYHKVWLAPTMFGRHYGGGMMPTPEQNRNADEKAVSVMLFHGMGKCRALAVFPSIFKGEHIKHKKNVTVLCGKNVTVRFDRPTALQIDGETVLNVSSYTVAV